MLFIVEVRDEYAFLFQRFAEFGRLNEAFRRFCRSYVGIIPENVKVTAVRGLGEALEIPIKVANALERKYDGIYISYSNVRKGWIIVRYVDGKATTHWLGKKLPEHLKDYVPKTVLRNVKEHLTEALQEVLNNG